VDERTRYLLSLLLIFFVLYLFFAMFSFLFTASDDQSQILVATKNKHVTNWTGYIGAKMANNIINNGFGVASFAALLFPFVLALRLVGKKLMPLWKAFILSAIILVWGSVFFSFFFYKFYQNWAVSFGGAHGDFMSEYLFENCGWGTILIIIAVFVMILMLCSSQSIFWIKNLFVRKKPALPIQSDEIVDEKAEEDVVEELVEQEEIINEITFSNDEEKDDFMVETPIEDSSEVEILDNENEIEVEIQDSLDTEMATNDPDYILKKYGKYDPRLDLMHYKFPQLSLLKTYPNENMPVVDMQEQNANKDKIVTTLRNFGIEVKSVKATVGPTVTLYEIVPQDGTRISKIRNLESDIMLSLKAKGIRIIAPIPGKGTIGIEVPNVKPQIVSMHSVIASKKFQEEEKYVLPVALGRTITNEVFMFDLAKMPHLLVAGATGKGKSVGLNAIITSLLYKKHPSELKMVLIDPKRVEFPVYAALEKHYMAKMPDQDSVIITDSTKVIQTLNSLVIEMEERFNLLNLARCRNIVEYNDKFINRRLNPEKGHRFLPYIVIVIDEFGDFIMVAGKEVEMPIARITQMGRAAGMHMILATQRPSVNIITGVIKSNVPGRIAFGVSSVIDSRTILDASGANQLEGKGDLLYSEGSELIRVQCAFIDTPEVENIVDYISKQQAYPSAYTLPECVESGGDLNVRGVDMTQRDPFFEEAARMVVSTQQGSTSNIQRKFSVGFNRAGRIMDQLEHAGIIGPQEGSKPRKVLVASEFELDQMLNNMN
ncbi:MAG: DNA translocase FtsK 4TM domain-containing protein, partial [Paludibacteraceae bacterium]|nr:DNA translocase FtsK 4TM domain-containing protein [Paludibacteraceae bacterium]